jgi:AcrR family transcriptional regulator
MTQAAKEPVRKRRRRYDSALRRQRAAETLERIVAAGVELLRGYAVWNWRELTVRAVAKQAGVNERTVYRHFANERELRDAVLARQQRMARVDLDGLELEDLEDVTARIFAYVSTFPLEPRTPRDPTLMAASKRQREALLAAVGPFAKKWSERDRTLAAAQGFLPGGSAGRSHRNLLVSPPAAPDRPGRDTVEIAGNAPVHVRVRWRFRCRVRVRVPLRCVRVRWSFSQRTNKTGHSEEQSRWS